VRCLPHCGVVHAEIGAHRTDHDLARVDTDPDVHQRAVLAASLLGVAADLVLHPKRRVARPHGVVLVGQRRPEQRHDPVAHHLVDRALVAVDGLHHQLEDGVEDLASLFRVTIRQQFHRALQIGEQHGDLLALTLHRSFGGENALGEVLGGV
jgi:hypothetical protein